MRQMKTLGDLNLCNNFLFAKVMEDAVICQSMLEAVLGVPIEGIAHAPLIEKTIENAYDGKGVRLDVYVTDVKNAVYNAEMQTRGGKVLPKRSRYYQGSIDMNLMGRGDPYQNLEPSYVIFICTFDPFGKGEYVYSFRNRCESDYGMELGDGAQKVFVNTKGRQGEASMELKEFLRYVEASTDEVAEQSTSELVKRIHKRVKEIKNDKKMEAEYMTLWMREKECYEEGREEEREEIMSHYVSSLKEDSLGDQEIVRDLMGRFHLSEGEARRYLSM